MLMTRERRPAIRTLRGWAIHVLQEASAIRECEEHGWMQDRAVDLAAIKHPRTTFVHDLASRLRCRKCTTASRRLSATLLQLAGQPRHPRTEH
ncbi:hypothetical protein [Bradyrhizobium sp. CCBAU 53421]|uniref:hypothetical protein n=1 Tax=Bradyrhizobium sp. CCBAU 53421 TaxID=1325120 RepID=UPI0018C05C1A|nr:hypothetical protein [Bradyrhizobium sp. CCBAU 53421]QOZ35943.1 hypothetical protein XH92_33180 [Bradyrhizobium sp. CCBAU 53421]